MSTTALVNHWTVLPTLGWTLGWTEILILAILGVLIFGRRLPEVGRSLGKGIVEFKKGLAGIEDDVNQASSPPQDPDRIEHPTSATVDTNANASESTSTSGDASKPST